MRRLLAACLVLSAVGPAAAEDYPHTFLKGRTVKMKLYLPDAEKVRAGGRTPGPSSTSPLRRPHVKFLGRPGPANRSQRTPDLADAIDRPATGAAQGQMAFQCPRGPLAAAPGSLTQRHAIPVIGDQAAPKHAPHRTPRRPAAPPPGG